MTRESEALAAFRQSASDLNMVMREQDHLIMRIIEDARRAIDARVKEQQTLREEAEDTARTAHDELWHLDRNERYARTDEKKLEYLQQTRRQAVLLAEAEAEAQNRARTAARWEDELKACQKDFEQAAFLVEQILHGPGNAYAETLGASIANLERVLDEYLQTDIYVRGKTR